MQPAPSPLARAPLAPRTAWLLALTATATMAVSYIDRQALAVLAPTVTRALAISDGLYGWLAAAFSLAYLACAPVAGRIIDRVGALRGLLGSVAVWSAVAASHSLVPGVAALFALRILLGAAESPSFPAAAQTVARALPPGQQSAGFGLLFTGSSLGAMLAPPLVVALEARFGWRIALAGTAAVGLAWVPIWLVVTRLPGAAAALAPVPAALAVVPAAALAPVPAVPAPAALGPVPVAPVPAVPAPAALGPVPVAPVPVPVPAAALPVAFAAPSPRPLLLEPAVARAVVLVVASAPIIALVLLWGAKILVAAHGLGQHDVGRYLWLPALLFDAGAVGFGLCGSARDRRRVARERRTGEAEADPGARLLVAAAALLTGAIGLVGAARTPWQTTFVESAALAGGGGLFALLTADMLRRLHPSRVAAAGGITAAAQSLAYIVANPIIGRVVDRTHSFAPVGAGLALWLAPGVLAWLLWGAPGCPASLAPSARPR